MNSLHIDHLEDRKDQRVCSLHFQETDFKPDIMSQLGMTPSKKQILSSAVPTLNALDTRAQSGALKKLNHKRIIQEILQKEEEVEITTEVKFSTIQTQTDLTMADMIDMESAKKSLRQTETKATKKIKISNHLVELGYSESVAKNMLRNPKKRKQKYSQVGIVTFLSFEILSKTRF